MTKYIKKLIYLFLMTTTLFSSQNKTDNIANISGTSLYNINQTALQDIIKAYIKSSPNLKALKITEDLSGKTYISLYRDDMGNLVEGELPDSLEQFEAYKATSKYKDEVVGEVFTYFTKVSKVIKKKDKRILFNENEVSYLENKNKITMCINPNFLPYEKIDKNGKYIGIGADVIDLVSKRINKKLILIPTTTLAQSIENIKNRNCDILPMATNTPNRQEYMNFTKPYINESLVIATKIDQFFIKDSSELSNKKIGVVNGYSSIEFLKKKNPMIDIVSVKSAKDGLEKVQNGELFAFIDALPVIAYVIQKNGFLDLKIAGSLKFQEKLSLASRKDEPILNSILQKSLNDIGDQNIRTIVSKWIAIKVEQSFDYTKLFYISLFFLIVLALVIHRNLTINKLNNQLDEKNKLLEELSITDNLTKLYNRNKLDDVLVNESHRANRFNHIFGVIIIDIDFFKSVNDIYGHQIGDTVLKEFANILKSNSRKTDTVGRWGGEEFLIICSETNLEGILSFANSLKEKISTFSFALGEQKTASFGVSIYEKDEDTDSMIKRADDALYNAKKNGRNSVEYI